MLVTECSLVLLQLNRAKALCCRNSGQTMALLRACLQKYRCSPLGSRPRRPLLLMILIWIASAESLINNWGVCVSITGILGWWCCVSIYYPPTDVLEQYIAYLDEVVPHLHGIPFVLGMDVNAVASMWHRKIGLRTSCHRAIHRGEVVSETLWKHDFFA